MSEAILEVVGVSKSFPIGRKRLFRRQRLLRALTDVSIRVETNATTGVGEDVVTYCGISSYGNPPNSLWLRPIRPFAAPQGAACANGATPYSPLVLLPDGVLYWSFQAPVVNYYAGGAGQMFRYTLPALPPGLTVTAQLLCLLGSTIPGGLGAPPNCSGTPTLYAASPGIWITF